MTSAAILRGYRLRTGQYWNLSGTFLFTINVMTALGFYVWFFYVYKYRITKVNAIKNYSQPIEWFGAPVPQSYEGRASVLTYAALAVPIHFLLMINASMCLVVHSLVWAKQLRNRLREKGPLSKGKNTLDNESPNCNRHSDVLRTPSRCSFSRKIMCCASLLCICNSVPLAAVLYYLVGACFFGMLQDSEFLKIFMFPIEFTTSGSLDQQPGYLRILYGFYIEGAMLLIGCALATLRRCSALGISGVTKKYRLYATED